MITHHSPIAHSAYHDLLGSLRDEIVADIVVLSGDIEATPSADLADVRPVTTVCDGRITFQA